MLYTLKLHCTLYHKDECLASYKAAREEVSKMVTYKHTTKVVRNDELIIKQR